MNNYTWEEFVESYCDWGLELLFYYKDMEIWFASGENEKGEQIAELSIRHSDGKDEHFDFSSARELVEKAKINGQYLKEIWEDFY